MYFLKFLVVARGNNSDPHSFISAFIEELKFVRKTKEKLKLVTFYVQLVIMSLLMASLM